MRPVVKRSRLGRRITNYLTGPFVAVVASSRKLSDRIVYTVQGLGDHDREEVEVMAGAPIVEWLAKGTEVLIVPHLLRTSELFLVAKQHSSSLISELAAAGDFAVERSGGTYALFKSGEIVLESDKITLGKNAIKPVVLNGDPTNAVMVGDHGYHSHTVTASATVVKAK